MYYTPLLAIKKIEWQYLPNFLNQNLFIQDVSQKRIILWYTLYK